MPAPSPLAIATQSVQRLVKEESYYRKELAQQSERVKKLEAELQASPDSADGNAQFMLKQEVRFPLHLSPSFPLAFVPSSIPSIGSQIAKWQTAGCRVIGSFPPL
ncbi:putative tubulin-specific chaperone Rbl2 [Nemania sp. NC0429]|nr:putative tubulin-specific chaperone Rbl2 [Nemania sp. NC0429]